MIGTSIERAVSLLAVVVTRADGAGSASTLKRQLEELADLPEPKIRIIAIAGSVALLLFILELVRRRRLKEEYSVIWMGTGVLLLLLAIWGGLLRSLTHAIGAISQASTLFFFGMIFVVFGLLHFSIRVSKLERRVVATIQEIALLSERDRAAGAEADGRSPAVEEEERSS
ncbi:MAG: DUF2304 domain-containing protein [Solirubrobacteraceae bacterium]